MSPEQERIESVALINDPGKWPCWPMLPLKKYTGRGGFPDCAILVDEGGRTKKVYMADMSLSNLSKDTPVKEYPHAEAILDDGWRID